MVTRSDIVAAARRCLGTPFRHQGRQPGRGLDCVGVIVWTAAEMGLSRYDVGNYSRLPQGDAIFRHLRRAGLREIPVARSAPADVLVMRFEREAQHVAMVTEAGILHAYMQAGAVVEHRLDLSWRARILAAFQFPGVN